MPAPFLRPSAFFAAALASLASSRENLPISGSFPRVFAFVLAAVLALCSCSLKTSPPDGRGNALFQPLERFGAFPLSRDEARSVAGRMSPFLRNERSMRALSVALERSAAHVSARPPGALALSMPGLDLTYGELGATLARLRALAPQLAAHPELLASEFRWHRLGPDFLFTGYYEPTLRAGREKSAARPHPLYKPPPDLRKGVPYHTRRDIDRKGVLAGRGLEIAWVESETEAFFLHIQGSGRLLFEDGSVRHVLYADKNNRPYVPIGRVLRDRGLLPEDGVNMPAIRAWLLANPDKRGELFDANPAYVFFRLAGQGPVGAMGKVLTPYVSVAVDTSVLPFGTALFSILPLPDGQGRDAPFYGLVLPQDRGGAIRGRRADLFCGAGEEAGNTAGHLNAKGAVYVLIKR
ncbi:MAG: MltA domain-containing protein [Desulfovibrio sp.]|jgi:membrane-bound lytic murein transglycosylase A|nr:MltA domain-containing protein [Desulfovibrio sp.]